MAKEKGYSDVLYLDSVHKKYLEEVSSCNVFVVKVWCHSLFEFCMHFIGFFLSFVCLHLLLSCYPSFSGHKLCLNMIFQS